MVFRVKGSVYRTENLTVSLLTDLRLPTGNEKDFLGSGAWGVKPFAAISAKTGWVTPHFNIGYQWNGRSVLAGDPNVDRKGKLPDALTYAGGFEVAATQGEAPYFAVFEADFADAAAMAAARASPQGQRVAADVANYATGGAVIIHYPVQDGTG